MRAFGPEESQAVHRHDSGERSGWARGEKVHVRRLPGFSNDTTPRFSDLNNQLQL